MLELYHDWDSLMSFKVRACLAEKQLQWQSRLVVLRHFEHLKPDYLELNPNGVVPTLVHDGQVITESSVINEYLHEVFPKQGLIPGTPYQRAQMRIWSKYFDDVIHPTLRPLSFQLLIKQRFSALSMEELETLIAHHPMPERAQAFRLLVNSDIDYAAVINSIESLQQIFARMEIILSQNQWLAGADYSLADVNTMPLIHRVEHLQLEFLWHAYPSVLQWIKQIRSRSAYQAARPNEQQCMPKPQTVALEKVREMLDLK